MNFTRVSAFTLLFGFNLQKRKSCVWLQIIPIRNVGLNTGGRRGEAAGRRTVTCLCGVEGEGVGDYLYLE